MVILVARCAAIDFPAKCMRLCNSQAACTLLDVLQQQLSLLHKARLVVC